MCSLLSCSDLSTNGPISEGELFIKLHDAPADYQQVNVSVNLVWIHRAGNNTNLGWSIVSENSVDVNLLNLRNGISEQLVLNKVTVGKYDRIKIRFGACTVVENGLEVPLILNSAPLLEHTLPYEFEVLEGEQTQLSFDFDVHRSVGKNGISYRLTPAIRVQNTQFCGWISGSIIDTAKVIIPSTIYTSTGIDSVSTQNELMTGSFQLSDLPENYYSIRITPVDSITFRSVTIDSLKVIRQKGTAVGVVVLDRR